MRIRLYHAKILAMENGFDWFEGEVWILNDRIEQVIKGTLTDVTESFDQQIG